MCTVRNFEKLLTVYTRTHTPSPFHICIMYLSTCLHTYIHTYTVYTAADVSVLKLAVVEKDNRLAEEIRKNESLESTLRHVSSLFLPSVYVCIY